MIIFIKPIDIEITEYPIWKRTYCATCQKEYVYELIVKYIAERPRSTSLKHVKQARQENETRIIERAERCIEPVPCPRCGQFQAEMIPAYNRRFSRWFTISMWMLCSFGSCLAMMIIMFFDDKPDKELNIRQHDPIILSMIAVGLVTGVLLGLMCLWYWLYQKKNYNPNEKLTEEYRFALAESRAVTLEVFRRRHPNAQVFD